MNSEKYMNSKKSFLFTTFLLLVLQDASLSLSLQCFVSKTSFNNILAYLVTKSLYFVSLCLLAHQDSTIELCQHLYLSQMIST